MRWSEKEIAILEAARQIIANEGYPHFSLRGIAAKSGIHLKSLQYYFKTKRDMLNAVVHYIIEHYYFDSYVKLFLKDPIDGPERRFAVIVDFLLDDLSDPFTSRFFPEFWALATRDEDVRAAMDIFYARHLASLESMIGELNPALDILTRRHRAALIGMMIEGLILILGHGKPKRAQNRNLKRVAKETIFAIATAQLLQGAVADNPRSSAANDLKIKRGNFSR